MKNILKKIALALSAAAVITTGAATFALAEPTAFEYRDHGVVRSLSAPTFSGQFLDEARHGGR